MSEENVRINRLAFVESGTGLGPKLLELLQEHTGNKINHFIILHRDTDEFTYWPNDPMVMNCCTNLPKDVAKDVLAVGLEAFEHPEIKRD